jgi:tryptophan-rich sensory protein
VVQKINSMELHYTIDPISYVSIPEIKKAITKDDYWALFGLSLFISSVFLAIYIPGVYTDWYSNLKTYDINVWIPRAGWVIALILSYYGIYIAAKNIDPVDEYRIPTMAVLYIIGTILLIFWTGVFLYAHSYIMGIIASLVLFLVQYYIFLYIWNTNIVASLFVIPLLFMYFYFFYSMLQLEYLNRT